MDNCDPRIMDGIAAERQVICFDNRGVGATKGKTPKTIAKWQETQAHLFMR